MDEYGKTKSKRGYCPALYAPSAPILAPFLHGKSGSLSQFLMNFYFFHHIVRIFFYSILAFLGKYTLPRASPSIDSREKAIIRPHRRPRKASIPYREPPLS